MNTGLGSEQSYCDHYGNDAPTTAINFPADEGWICSDFRINAHNGYVCDCRSWLTGQQALHYRGDRCISGFMQEMQMVGDQRLRVTSPTGIGDDGAQPL